MSCLLHSLRLSTARPSPSQCTYSHGKKNQSSWPNQTKVLEKKYKAIIIMHKSSTKTQIIFIDRSDHKLAIHRIPTNTPQKRVTSNRSLKSSRRTLYWRSKREKNPSSYCLRTRRSVVNYSRIIEGAIVMMKNPSVIVDPSDRVPEKASRLDLVVPELAAVETLISRLP
mgnify:CR=1 FL=1